MPKPVKRYVPRDYLYTVPAGLGSDAHEVVLKSDYDRDLKEARTVLEELLEDCEDMDQDRVAIVAARAFLARTEGEG